MRCWAIMIALTIVLTGCALQPSANELFAKTTQNNSLSPTHYAEETISASIIKEPTLPSSGGRQPVILSRDPVGIHDENSFFGGSTFIGEPDPLPGEEKRDYDRNCLAEIYRTFYPWNGEEDAFEALAQRVHRETKRINQPDEILVPYLLTEESVNLSDKELYEKLTEITTAYVFSKHIDSMNYRLIAINADTERVTMRYDPTWQYYIQVWDDAHIWAQPLCENIDLIFDQAVFVTDPDGNEIVLLCGQTSMPNGTGLAVAGTRFVLEDGIWGPIRWDEIFDEVTPMTNLGICSYGIIMMIYPDWLMIPHEGPKYALELSEGGFFWADFSAYPDYPANENLPSKECLFRLNWSRD